MVFTTLNIETGESWPTTFEDLRARLEQRYPPPAASDHIREEWGVALDYYALAVEQANIERGRLYGPLTRDSLLRATIALELGLKDRLKASGDETLFPLIEKAIKANLVPGPAPFTRRYKKEHPGDVGNIWDLIIEVRNQYAHGDPQKPTLGPISLEPIGFIWRMLKRLYDAGTLAP